ncbi:dnaJ/Hsp40 cysteine-rich domain superfamily protein [Tasmannia lanceolata]|uniref:dnaJ/Hsp40 cysteine-rich domain superfamily protein n=1 Tax=Tasmannia lanceolata TaxID=3420 RepID=UPI0040647EA6
MSICSCNRVVIFRGTAYRFFPSRRVDSINYRRLIRVCGGARASMVDSYESSSDFVKRMEQAWLISQQPRPVACTSCNSNGHVECKWCGGTGFFILGDNMLCEVPSRNSTCVICAGKGSTCCSDCKGTGFRAKWLEPPHTK